MYRAGIIGCGWIGVGISDKTIDTKADTHFKAYQSCPDTQVVALCDKDDQKIIRHFNKYSALPLGTFPTDALWVDYLPMVKKLNLDIVSVCTPPETHCQIVCDVAPYVKAILCEKPIALTIDDANTMIEICRHYKTLLQINHQRAFTIPKFRFSRDIIDTGTHMFELLTRLFGEYEGNLGNLWFFGDTTIEIEYVDTSHLPWAESHIFELDATHNKDLMIIDSVKALVESLKTGAPSHCSGEQGREALRLALIFKEQLKGGI